MNDWGGLRGIVEEAKQVAERERSRPLVDCPNCGTPLQKNTRGQVNCPMGDFWAPSDARVR